MQTKNISLPKQHNPNNLYIYMDESGDLGFAKNKKGSENFVITFLITDNPKSIEKIVKKTHTYLKRTTRKSAHILHANKQKHSIKKYLLKHLTQKSCEVAFITLHKNDIMIPKLQHDMYNTLTQALMEALFALKHINTAKQQVTLIASRRETNKILNNTFIDSLKKHIYTKFTKELTIYIKPPHTEKALQAVDFVSWALYRKIEYNDDAYYNSIKSIIITQKIYRE